MIENIKKMLLKQIKGGKRGSVFTPSHFSDLGARTAIDKALCDATD
jgi:hypothetical protein